MTDHDRHLLGIRFLEIEAELQALADGRVVEGDPAEVEERLLEEQEEIEYWLGERIISSGVKARVLDNLHRRRRPAESPKTTVTLPRRKPSGSGIVAAMNFATSCAETRV
jgi:hypothetical protein